MDQTKLDEFAEGLKQQLETFIRENDLVPHGYFFEWKVRFTHYRPENHGMVCESQAKLSGPHWLPQEKVLPTPEEWDEILALPEFNQDRDQSAWIRQFVVALKNSPDGQMHTRHAHYATAVNKALENADSDFRVFGQAGSRTFRIRKTR